MNLFDIYKNFRRGDPILSADFNALQNSLVSSFRKLGTERTDSTPGVEEPFSVGTPVFPANATTKTYVDALIATVAPSQGPKGAKGDKGDQGDSLRIVGNASSYYTLPESALQGDIWFTTDTAKLWLWDDSSAGWVDLGEVQGPQGPAGSKGKDGVNGTNGAKGATGSGGPAGSRGSQGAQGPRGYTGYTGATGPAGPAYSGPVIPSGQSPGETLWWGGVYGWAPGDGLKVVEPEGTIAVRRLRGGGSKIVMADNDGNLFPYTSYRILSLDSDLEGIDETIKELQARIKRLENKQ